MIITKPLVVLDLETTGTWIDRDKIVEIAMIKSYPDGAKETFHKLINPGIPIPPVASQLIGIKDDDVKDCPLFKDFANPILKFIGDCDLAGFNIERFDLPLLEREMSEAGVEFRWQRLKIFDAQKVYHLNEKRDLAAAYQFYCTKTLENAHSAMADTQAALEILSAQVDKYGNGAKELSVLSAFDYKSNAEFYDEERKFRWWNGKLYMMFGKYAKQYSLQELVKKDRGYLEWIVSANFSDEIKALVEEALQGKFPEPENASLKPNFALDTKQR
jgi:DNA polymerase-3 subunit epsilon